MCHDRIFMKYLLVSILFTQVILAKETPTIHFEDKVTWRQIFDAGFRPKHFVGLERNSCICENQEFFLRFKNRDKKFRVGNGRISLSFYHDDFLSMIWHQGSERITLEEGKRRAGEFRELFDGYITQEITMPRLIDPSGLVDAGNNENNIKARVGEYLIWYGFDNSMRKDKPIIPHFYISWSYPGRPDVRMKDVGDVVRPPKGYEWYSLDPKVNTPDPGTDSENLPEADVKIPGKEVSNLPSVEAKDKNAESSGKEEEDQQ